MGYSGNTLQYGTNKTCFKILLILTFWNECNVHGFGDWWHQNFFSRPKVSCIYLVSYFLYWYSVIHRLFIILQYCNNPQSDIVSLSLPCRMIQKIKSAKNPLTCSMHSIHYHYVTFTYTLVFSECSSLRYPDYNGLKVVCKPSHGKQPIIISSFTWCLSVHPSTHFSVGQQQYWSLK